MKNGWFTEKGDALECKWGEHHIVAGEYLKKDLPIGVGIKGWLKIL